MRFGVCAGIDKAAILADAGYDYIELSAAGDLIPDSNEVAWDKKRHAILALPLPVEAFNSFVRTGKIVGPEADPARLEQYVHTCLARAGEVGGKIVVFGSGGARNVPDGYERAAAQADLLRFLTFCADASDETGVVVVIEPLNRSESNILNTVHEGAQLARMVNRAGVRNLADTYHMEKDGESLSAIIADADVLAHVHTADTNRLAPGTGTYDHRAFFAALKQANYDARVSIEGGWGDFVKEAPAALAHLRHATTAV